MAELFVKLLNMSISASWIVVAVVIIRLLLKKAPKSVLCLLWGFVGFRLLVPFSFESVLSLIPKKELVPQSVLDTGGFVSSNLTEDTYNVIRNSVDIGNVPVTVVSHSSESSDVFRVILSVVPYVWMVGIFVFVLYALFSWLKLHKRVSESVCIEKSVYICDRIDSPFILGVFMPKIYLPSSITEKESVHVISHEKAHLKRFDHLWKPLGFLFLAVYWFNPLMWVAYILLCRDIELACDEKVIRNMSSEDKKSYSDALLNCSVNHRLVTVCPLAFGEVGVKERITSVLSYKKPAFWIIVLSAVLCAVLAVCFLTDPKSNVKELVGSNYTVHEVLSGDEEDLPEYCITADFFLYYRESEDGAWNKIGRLEKAYLSDKDIEASILSGINIDAVSDSYTLFYGNCYYVVFKTEKGETYLGKGLSSEAVTDLYLLESKLGNGEIDVSFFNRSLNAVAGGYVSAFSFFESDDIPGYMIVGFVSGEESYTEFLNDMGYAIFSVHDDGYRLLKWYVYPDAALVKGGIYICPDPAVADDGDNMTDKNTYDVVLSCNSSLSSIVRTVRNDGSSFKNTYEVSGVRTMTLFRWADDHVSADSSVSMKFYDADGKQIITTNILPSEGGTLRAVSGGSQSLIYAFESDTPLEDIKSKINWLDLSMDENASTPFDVYAGDNEIYGWYSLYDAETLESVDFIRPSGLEPQTYMLQNTVRGRSYIVVFRANISTDGYDDTVYAFGINVPLAKSVTDPYAASESPYTWLRNVTKDDINAVYARIGSGDEINCGVKIIRTLVSALNSIPTHSVYPGKGVNGDVALTVKCAEKTYILEYSDGIIEISFDEETALLYPDAHWQINDANLVSFFESLLSEGVSFVGDNDVLDVAEDFIRKYFSFYTEGDLDYMDFGTYTDNLYLAEALEYWRDSYVKADVYDFKRHDPSTSSTAVYIDDCHEDLVAVKATLLVATSGERFGYTMLLLFKESSSGYLITDFECSGAWHWRTEYRYGEFGYYPVDDWAENGELYLARIKGESELPPIKDIGIDLLDRFAANADSFMDMYTVYAVDFEGYDYPWQSLSSQVTAIASQTESRGVIIVFESGRYLAYVHSYVLDPLLLDGTISSFYYSDSGIVPFGEYEDYVQGDGKCSYEDARYIVVLD